MKLAIAGKGGSGKTSISGTMARALAREGHSVLAIDGDSNPNLALTLGIPAEEVNAVPTLPRGLIKRTDSGVELTQTFQEVRSSHSLKGPDDVTLLVMAHPNPEEAGTGCLCGMHAAVRTLIDAVPGEEHDVTILDTEATPEHLTRGTAKYADAMLAVVEPYYKSLETARRMAALALDLGLVNVGLIANKVRDDADLEAVREFAGAHELGIAGVIPYDDALPRAERDRRSPIDAAPGSPGVEAISRLASQVLDDLRDVATVSGPGPRKPGTCPWRPGSDDE